MVLQVHQGPTTATTAPASGVFAPPAAGTGAGSGQAPGDSVQGLGEASIFGNLLATNPGALDEPATIGFTRSNAPDRHRGAPSRYSLRDAILLPYSMTEGEVRQTQQKLVDAGFLAPGEYIPGVYDRPTSLAWQGSLEVTYQRNAANVANGQEPWSLDRTFVVYGDARRRAAQEAIDAGARLDEPGQTIDGGGGGGGGSDGEGQPFIGNQVVTPEDPATLARIADDIARDVFGRIATDEERQKMVAHLGELDRTARTKVAEAQLGNARGALAARQAGGGPNTITGDLAGQIGLTLASQFGLTRTSHHRSPEANAAAGGVRNSDHLTGMAVDLSGSAEKMLALYEWAKQHEGPGKLFRIVIHKNEDPEGHDDHVHLSFNAELDGAIPVEVAGDIAMGGQSDLDRWLTATASLESQGWADPYRAQGPATRYGRAYGKYQMLPGTFAEGARLAGVVAPDIRNPAHQEAAARALATAYYAELQDWQLVSVAWHAGIGVARRAKTDRSVLTGVSDGIMETADYAMEAMERMGSVPLTGSGGAVDPNTLGGISEVTQVDLEARAEAKFRAENPGEAGAHDVAEQYASFSRLIGGGVRSATAS